MNTGRELKFRHTHFSHVAHLQACHLHGNRVRNDIIAGVAKQLDWLFNNLQVHIGTNRCKLQRTVKPSVCAAGFEVIPQQCFRHQTSPYLKPTILRDYLVAQSIE